MSIDLTRVSVGQEEPARGPQAAAKTGPDAARAAEQQRDQVRRIAQEFESMLLRQVLRDMRKAGAWEDEPRGYGAETMGDVIDAELATHLARNKGLGLAEQMLSSLDRMANGSRSASPFSMPGMPSMPAMPSLPSVQQMLLSLPEMPDVPVLPSRPDSPAPSGSSLHEALAPPPALVAGPAPDAHEAHDHGSSEVTSGFGWRRDPINGRQTFHRGIDLAAYYGQDVVAARAGRVVFSGEQGSYGTTVLVEHQDGTTSRYAHLSQALVEPGTMVNAGQLLGQAGSSGRATGTHLHFEVTSADGQPLSPSEWSNGVIG